MRKDIVTITLMIILFTFFSPNTNIDLLGLIKADKIIFVGGSGLGNFTNIQSAINYSSNGDTIYLYPGTYDENIIINRSINLIGESKEICNIKGIGQTVTIVIKNDSVVLKNISVFSNMTCISDSCSFLNITNCILVSEKGCAMWLDFSDNVTINNCTINGDESIYLSSTKNAIIENCDFHSYGLGLNIQVSSNLLIKVCNFSDNVNQYGTQAIVIGSDCHNCVIQDSIFSRCGNCAIALQGDSNFPIKDIQIINNTITDNRYFGIWVISSVAEIKNCIIKNNLHGIFIGNNSFISLENNHIGENSYCGVRASDNCFIQLMGNILYNNGIKNCSIVREWTIFIELYVNGQRISGMDYYKNYKCSNITDGYECYTQYYSLIEYLIINDTKINYNPYYITVEYNGITLHRTIILGKNTSHQIFFIEKNEPPYITLIISTVIILIIVSCIILLWKKRIIKNKRNK